MHLEQSVHPDRDGIFILMRPDRNGPTPVEVETDFSRDELGAIFEFTGEDSSWHQLDGVLSSEAMHGSSLPREINSDNYCDFPQGYGLKSRKSAILQMNVLHTVLSLLPVDLTPGTASRKFLDKTFIRNNPEDVAPLIEIVRGELGAMIDEHDWSIDIEEEKSEAMKIIERVRRVLGMFGVE